MWIPITLAAATFQVLRTARQHRLRALLSVNAAGFVRYAYGFPLAATASVIVFVLAGQDLPEVPARFWPIVAGAGTAQILGTIALLRAFDLRDFAIGTVYAKTEVLLVAIVSAVALGEPLAPLGWAGAAMCTLGVAWLGAPRRLGDVLGRAADPAALMGVLAALGFAVAAAGIRAAATSMDDAEPAWTRALLTLTAMLAVQTTVNGVQLLASDRSQLVAVGTAWRAALWALAMTLTNAAKVRTLGQVELVLAFVVSVVWLRERHERAEYLASALVLTGIVAVVALG
jgi:drug/metabolite transporter (DMT)-like permease